MPTRAIENCTHALARRMLLHESNEARLGCLSLSTRARTSAAFRGHGMFTAPLAASLQRLRAAHLAIVSKLKDARRSPGVTGWYLSINVITSHPSNLKRTRESVRRR